MNQLVVKQSRLESFVESWMNTASGFIISWGYFGGESIMKHQIKMEKLRAIFDRCWDIADAKGRDYSGTTDSMSNFRDFGWKGIVVRIGDKYHCVKNISKKGEVAVKDESVEDTLYDMINYSALALIMKEDEDASSDFGH